MQTSDTEKPKFEVGDKVTVHNKIKSVSYTRHWNGEVIAVQWDEPFKVWVYDVKFQRSGRTFKYVEGLVSKQIDVTTRCRQFQFGKSKPP